MNNIADLKDPKDKKGRTYREVNLDKRHKYDLGSLVEFEDGVRLFITRHVRDCDGTPLYCVGFDNNTVLSNCAEIGFKCV